MTWLSRCPSRPKPSTVSSGVHGCARLCSFSDARSTMMSAMNYSCKSFLLRAISSLIVSWTLGSWAGYTTVVSMDGWSETSANSLSGGTIYTISSDKTLTAPRLSASLTVDASESNPAVIYIPSGRPPQPDRHLPSGCGEQRLCDQRIVVLHRRGARLVEVAQVRRREARRRPWAVAERAVRDVEHAPLAERRLHQIRPVPA